MLSLAASTLDVVLRGGLVAHIQAPKIRPNEQIDLRSGGSGGPLQPLLHSPNPLHPAVGGLDAPQHSASFKPAHASHRRGDAEFRPCGVEVCR